MENILDIEFVHYDLGKISIREFFCTLLMTVWEEEEGFSGKRAFGNSSWQYDVYQCLEDNNLVEINCSRMKADEFINNNILKPLFGL